MSTDLEDIKKPKLIRSSHLALRFYEHDGWTEEKVKYYVKAGTVIHMTSELFKELDYFIPDIGTLLNIEALVADGHTVQDYNNTFHTDPEAISTYLKQQSW